MLWIVTLTLPNYLLALTEEEEVDVKRFITLYTKARSETKNILLRELGNEGKEFIHPDDPNKILRVYKFSRRDDSIEIGDEQVAIQKLMTKSGELGNQIPITQTLYRALSFPFGQNWGISLEMERFRGDLLNGLFIDPALVVTLQDFSLRLEMYKQLAFAFQQFAALDLKYCNIEVQRIIYKRPSDDFSTFPPTETDAAFNFVLSDFRYVRDLGTPCDQGMPSTWDHSDSQKDIPKSSKCKAKIEIFGLGMLILKIETLSLIISDSGMESAKLRSQKVSEALNTLPDAPDDIVEYFGKADAIMKMTTYKILDEIMNWNLFYNTGIEDVDNPVRVIDGTSLLKNLAYVEQANALIFEQRDLDRHSSLEGNQALRGKIIKNYAALNTLLQSMLPTIM